MEVAQAMCFANKLSDDAKANPVWESLIRCLLYVSPGYHPAPMSQDAWRSHLLSPSHQGKKEPPGGPWGGLESNPPALPTESSQPQCLQVSRVARYPHLPDDLWLGSCGSHSQDTAMKSLYRKELGLSWRVQGDSKSGKSQCF